MYKKAMFLFVCAALLCGLTGCAGDPEQAYDISEDTDISASSSSESDTIETQKLSETSDTAVSISTAELHSVSGDRLDMPSDHSFNTDNIAQYNGMSYVLTSFGDIHTDYPEYITVYEGDVIGGLTVTDAEYSHCFSLSDDGGVAYEYPLSASLRLDGEMTLTGILAQAYSSDDYGFEIYGDSIMFYPYSSSLNESGFPSLHSEMISAEFVNDSNEVILFYEETIPFKLTANEDIQTLLNESKVREVEITLSDIEQEWYYGNGSGYNPCGASIVSVTPI